MSERKFDVALSFAGEDREIALRLRAKLEEYEIRVFYDESEKAEIWGKNLYEYLTEIYQNQASFCIMLISDAYASKIWTNHERSAAQARALVEAGEYILPIRLDQTELPGLMPTTAYLSYDDHTDSDIARLVLQKLAKQGGSERVVKAPDVEHYRTLDVVPPEFFGVDLGTKAVVFQVTTGKVVECKGGGSSQEVWMISNGRELGLNVPDSLLRARKGHVVSCVAVAPEQSLPTCLVAAMNYSTDNLVLEDREFRWLAAAVTSGAEKASASLQRVGKLALLKSFGIAFGCWLLAVFIFDSQVIINFIFFGSLGFSLIEPFLSGSVIKAHANRMTEVVCGQFGKAPPSTD